MACDMTTMFDTTTHKRARPLRVSYAGSRTASGMHFVYHLPDVCYLPSPRTLCGQQNPQWHAFRLPFVNSLLTCVQPGTHVIQHHVTPQYCGATKQKRARPTSCRGAEIWACLPEDAQIRCLTPTT